MEDIRLDPHGVGLGPARLPYAASRLSCPAVPGLVNRRSLVLRNKMIVVDMMGHGHHRQWHHQQANDTVAATHACIVAADCFFPAAYTDHWGIQGDDRDGDERRRGLCFDGVC